MYSQDLDCLIGDSKYGINGILKTLIASSATQSRELPVDFQALDCLIGFSKLGITSGFSRP